MSLGKDILKEIKKDKIKPKAKWIFILKNFLTWILGLLSLIIGAITVSVMIYVIKTNDYGFYKMIHPSPLNLIAKTLPYFWITLTILFILVVNYNLKQTKKGYKVELYKIIALVLILSVVFGIFFYNIGLGQAIDTLFCKKMPFYNKIDHTRKMMWLQEDQGMIAGRIISVQDDNNFDLEDFNEKLWHIIKIKEEMLTPQFKRLQQIKIIPELDLEIRVYGEKIDENNFQALIIRPMHSRRLLKIKN